MNQYANLAHRKAHSGAHGSSPRKKKPTSRLGRFVAWFKALPLKKKIMVIATPILAFLILTPIVTYLLLANDIKDPERLMNRNNTGIALTDVKGETFYSVGRAEHRDMVKLDDISPYMQKALIASEDKDFYKHSGFSVLSIFRAAFTRVGGGSTITQQLVKNTLLTDDHSYIRKYQELFMAIAVEQNYSKDEILAMYLNSVYFGENAFGIEEAARVYFGKAPKDLTLAESAMLVGVLPAPSAYSPISGNPEYARQRQTTVLTRMVTNGFITPEEKQAALDVELAYASSSESQTSIAPHFAEMVINELSKKYGYEKVMRSGFRVKTSLDLTAQQALVDSVNRGMAHINAMGGSNASGVIIDPVTGEIRALVGSADYNNDQWGKVNMVTTARQPGSSFKSIYYAAALADGVVTPATIFKDERTDFGGYVPLNADKRFRGNVSVRSAISQSLNIPSVLLMQQYGIEKSITAAKNLGITTIDAKNNYGLSLALGSAEVPLLEMTHAYTAFAGQGQQQNLVSVLEINDKFGKKTFTATHSAKQAINKEGAFLISSILSDNAARAPIFGSSLTVGGHTVAVKTGTTNDNRDAWTIGYNPEYAVGVWVGNNDNTAMRSGGSDMAGPIWRNTMTKLLSGRKDVKFAVPSSIVQRDVCKANGGLANRVGPNTYKEYFMAGALPTNSCEAAPTMIDVCEKATGKVISIDETTYDETKHSKDTANCKPPTQEVCEIATGKVITINPADFDSAKHSTDITNCKPPQDDDTTTPTLPTTP